MNNILVYSLHRSATNFLHELTANVCKEMNIQYYSINDENYFKSIINGGWKDFIQNRTGCFGPIRIGEAEPSVPYDFLLDNIVVQVRDPRDILTSLYYALCYRFPLKEDGYPTKELQKKWIADGIDKFVLDSSKDIAVNVNYLIRKIIHHDNVNLLRYETMVSDFGRWLESYLSVFPLNKNIIKTALFKNLHSKYCNEFSVKKEDQQSHKRQVLPGDHIRKLKPETIDRLNTIFSESLEYLEYKI